LDEPSIGLHPRDTQRLIKVLMQLRDLGNTVIVVEHDEEIIKAADHVIDIGPLAGEFGGELVFEGNFENLVQDKNSLTGQYLSGRMKIPLPERRRKWKEFIELSGARENNLKNLQVKFPLKVLTAVTGVSGSGKTTLVKKILYSALKKIHGGHAEKTGKFDRLDGDIYSIVGVELVDQNPIGRSTRSNPATYVKAWDEIRTLFSSQPLAQMRGYKPGIFSFNIEGGRCEECEGEGVVHIEMQFMADIALTCDACQGKRFKSEVLDVTYRDKNVAEVLDMSVGQALEFFASDKDNESLSQKITSKLQPLADVGLGYLRLGQSSSTLSGGEAQRIKLASFLTKGQAVHPTLFIFDEPTTGLHYHDINKLMQAFDALIQRQHTVIVIEHNMEVIKCADWIIDLGPEGGEKGGLLVSAGTPEDLIKNHQSYTAGFLKEKLMND
jgi:excinuclease ABC subunit A